MKHADRVCGGALALLSPGRAFAQTSTGDFVNKMQYPSRVVKTRASVRVEYAKVFGGRFFVLSNTGARAMGNFVMRGKAAVIFGKPFGDLSFQFRRGRTLETYLGLECQSSQSRSPSAEALDPPVSERGGRKLLSVARDRQTARVSGKKKFLNDDLFISLKNFRFWLHIGHFAMLLTKWSVNDNVSSSLNLAVSSKNHRDGSLWGVRDQGQALFKIRYQF